LSYRILLRGEIASSLRSSQRQRELGSHASGGPQARQTVALLPASVEIRRIEPSARTPRAAPAIRDR